MLDFSSSLYLGLRHPGQQLGSWQSLTLGKPTMLQPIANYRELLNELERLTGTQDMILGTSSLQLFFDFAIWLRNQPVEVFLDEYCYPIAKKAFTAVHNTTLSGYLRHYEPSDLDRVLSTCSQAGRRPVLVIDGYSPVSGQLCPLEQYCEVLEKYNGIAIVDDTQSLGVFGQHASVDLPYGKGGGGIIMNNNINYENIIYISSMAKGFGVPVAFLSTTKMDISDYLEHSLTNNHCSPVSIAHALSIKHALKLNRNHGEQIRNKLYQLVFKFKQRLSQAGISTIGGDFPFQTLSKHNRIDATGLYEFLQNKGFTSVLHELKSSDSTAISFLITARHSFADIYSLTSQIINYMCMYHSRNRARGTYAFAYPYI